MTAVVDGEEICVSPAFSGAEGRYEDWIYLRLLEREWKRPVLDDEDSKSANGNHCSPRAAIVLLFWSYFETRIDRLLRVAFRNIPSALAENTLQRYSSIGARLDRLYNILFGTTYGKDLSELGYEHVWRHLTEVQQSRNAFSHGNPGAINDQLVESVIAMLEIEHESWIAVFNRCISRSRDKE